MNCTLCGNILKNREDEYFFICDTCGAYVKDDEFYLSSESERSRYKEHNNDVDDERYQNFTSSITDAVLSNYDKRHLGLDYGCGTGPVVSEILQDNNYKVKLYDPFFKPNQEYLNYEYDYIFSCEVFEHFHSPKEEIEKLLNLLKDNGMLLIMTHLYDTEIEFKNWYYRNDPTHVFIFTNKTISYIAHCYNLHIESNDNRTIIFRKL